MFKRGTATLDISRIQFKYGDFRDIKDFAGTSEVDAPLYRFNATVFQIYLSMYF